MRPERMQTGRRARDRGPTRRRRLRVASFALLATLMAGCATGPTIPGFSVPVNGVQTGYVSGCNLTSGSATPEFIVMVSHRVYFEYTVEGQPGVGGQGWTIDGGLREDFGPGQQLAVTGYWPQGTCVNVTLYDLDGGGPFTFVPIWQYFCRSGTEPGCPDLPA